MTARYCICDARDPRAVRRMPGTRRYANLDYAIATATRLQAKRREIQGAGDERIRVMAEVAPDEFRALDREEWQEWLRCRRT